ncbi:CPCC family cysteine-rich protein [Kitasatospora sp. NPDC094028]
MTDTRRPCPCCGHLVHSAGTGWPGSHGICPVCFWEDDPVQLRWPFTGGGANRTCLAEAQRNVREFGASEQRRARFVRAPAADEPLDRDWRPIDPATDVFEDWESPDRRPWPEDRTVLCWWLPSFWGAAGGREGRP